MLDNNSTDVFGKVHLGYVVIGSRKLDAWMTFLTQGIGLHLACESTDVLAWRMDDHARRLIVQNGDAEDVTAIDRDALTVDEATWQAGRTYPNMSTWGHDIPGRFSSEMKFSHLIHAVRSLRKSEYLPW